LLESSNALRQILLQLLCRQILTRCQKIAGIIALKNMCMPGIPISNAIGIRKDEGSGIMFLAKNTGYLKTHPQPQCPEHGFTGGLSEHAQLREFPKQYDDPLLQNGLQLCGRQKMTRRNKTATPR